MKVALCLHGLVGTDDKYGRGNKIINYKIGHKHFKEHVIDVNEHVDVFMHTWSTDYKDRLIEAYNPVAIKAEEQMKTPFQDLPGSVYFPGSTKAMENTGMHANYCRWKSVKEVISLVNQSETKYDWILLTRFDIAFMVDFDFSEYDNNKFYAQGPAGPYERGLNLINDLWFFANQENMTIFSKLYDRLPAVIVENEWDDEDADRYQNVLQDFHEPDWGFVKVLLQRSSDPNEPQYLEHIISNHMLARRHLIETGLQNNLEYAFTREWNGSPGKLSTETPLVRWYYMNRV